MSRFSVLTLACLGAITSVVLTAPSDVLAGPREVVTKSNFNPPPSPSRMGWRSAFQRQELPTKSQSMAAKMLGRTNEEDQRKKEPSRHRMYANCMLSAKERHNAAMANINRRYGYDVKGTAGRALGNQAKEMNEESKRFQMDLAECEHIRKA